MNDFYENAEEVERGMEVLRIQDTTIERKMNDIYENDEEIQRGMEVLIVDNDVESLSLEESVLSELAYEVSTCSLGEDALKLLRKKKRDFDLIFVDAKIPDMDCCTLLKHIKEEKDVPTIMMLSEDAKKPSLIWEGIKHGACNFVNKPMNKYVVEHMWHHAAKKKRRYSEQMEMDGGRLKEHESSSNGAATELVLKYYKEF